MRAYSDQDVIKLIAEYMNGSDNPDQVGYREQAYTREFADKERFLWGLKHISKLGGFQNKKILDVGCGFGWQAFAFSLLDSKNRVVGIDILPSMIDGMTESIAHMRKKGIEFDLTPIEGDICNPNLEAGSFDAIYSSEAIEHVHDLKEMFLRCAELLKPGGKLILINDSNPLHKQTRDETMAMWQERETSWDWIAKLRDWRPIEHGDAKPFAIMREEIVREANPHLTDADVKDVVEKTAGLMKERIQILARNYITGVNFPAVDKYDRCRNPETGEYAERLLDPFMLAEMLKRAGFRTKVRHMFRKFPVSLANAIQLRPLNNLLFNVRGVFVILAIKI